MRKLLLVVCLCWIGALAAHAQEATPDVTPEMTPAASAWLVDGVERTYTLYVPETVTAPAPLVIVLHGRFGTGAEMADYSQFNRVADDEGFIVAYPDGIDGEWNFVRAVPGYDNPRDDLAFLVALIDHIAAEHAVDVTRVYLAGFSNGGFMVQRAACEDPTRFAGFATVSAAAFGGMQDVCTSELPAPMLMLHGTADENIPWDGTGVTRNGQTIYVTYPIGTTFSYWASVNGCDQDASTTDIPATETATSVRVLTVTCPAGTAVALYGILDGGHNWPRPDLEPYPASGAINHDIDAAREIWNFFEPLSREQAE